MFLVSNVPLWLQIMGEFTGVLLLILLGNGVCFSVTHRKMFANQGNKWITIILGWAVAVFVGAFVASAMGSPGHINPAVSLYFAINSKTWNPIAYIPMQFLGAIVAQILLYGLNWNFIKSEIENEPKKDLTRNSSCTNPVFEDKKSMISNFFYELIGTSILIAIIMIISNVYAGNATLNILIVTTTILGIGASLGSVTGFAINPARDLGPRIVYQILRTTTNNKLVSANWSYSWIPVIAPLLAGTLFGLVSLLF